MRLRVDVFVVEQACVYPELDDADVLPDTLHCQGRIEGKLVVYARMMGLTSSSDDKPATDLIRIGRVVSHENHRGQGLAKQLMLELLAHAEAAAPGRSIALSAQTPVVGFYRTLGFNVVSGEYIEDGIPHIDMERRTTYG